MKFQWDEKKERANVEKHGVSFQEATTVFGDPLAGTIPDSDHSHGEPRFITIGHSSGNRLIVVSHKGRRREFQIHQRPRGEYP